MPVLHGGASLDRNIISHEYLSIDPEEIFKIVKVHLPGLLLAIQQIRNDIAASI